MFEEKHVLGRCLLFLLFRLLRLCVRSNDGMVMLHLEVERVLLEEKHVLSFSSSSSSSSSSFAFECWYGHVQFGGGCSWRTAGQWFEVPLLGSTPPPPYSLSWKPEARLKMSMT